MGWRRFAIGTLLTLTAAPLCAPVAGVAQVRAHGPAVPFSLSGTVKKITPKANQVTIVENRHIYVLTTNSSTSFTVKSKTVTIKKLTVGERVRVIGKSLGPLLLALTIAA